MRKFLYLILLLPLVSFAQTKEINEFAEQTSPAPDADFVLIDESGSGVYKKVLIRNLAKGRQVMWVPAGAMRTTASNGAASLETTETTSGRPDLNTLDFDSSSDEHAQFSIAFPDAWDEGTVTFQALWTTTATDTDGVAWALQGVCAANDDTIDVAYGTAVVVTDDNGGAAEDMMLSPESSAVTLAGTPGEDELCVFRVFRDVSDANDDMAEDARLIGIKAYWTTVAPTE